VGCIFILPPWHRNSSLTFTPHLPKTSACTLAAETAACTTQKPAAGEQKHAYLVSFCLPEGYAEVSGPGVVEFRLEFCGSSQLTFMYAEAS